MRLERILETVLYYSSGQEEELARFYGEVLGLRAVGRTGLTFRVGEGLLLLFDSSLSSGQSQPPPHGARGPIHTCFVARADEYGDWKQRLTEAGASCTGMPDFSRFASSGGRYRIASRERPGCSTLSNGVPLATTLPSVTRVSRTRPAYGLVT